MSDVPAPLRASRWRINLLRKMVNLFFAAIVRRQVTGLENIPAASPCVLIFNHLSNFDPPLIFSVLRRTDVTGLLASEYRERLFHRLALEWVGALWIRRGASDRAALKAAMKLLDYGWIVGIAPEGRRSPTKSLIAAKRGPAFLASYANVPVLPVGVTGTERIGWSLKRLRRAPVTLRFGKPFQLPPLEGANHRQQLQANTETMMCQLAALVPPAYRGVYADHPRLQALLQEQAGTARQS